MPFTNQNIVKRGASRAAQIVAAILAALLCAGSACNRAAPPASQPSEPPQTALAEDAQSPTPIEPLPALAEGWDGWSRAEAAARLDDAALAVSAAVRLTQLAGVAWGEASQPLTPQTIAELRLERLYDSTWALGRGADERKPLRAAVLIGPEGAVTVPVDGDEQARSELHVSDDPDAFPHLILTPTRVLLVLEEGPEAALVARDLGAARFAVRQPGGYRCVALVVGEPQSDEAAPAEQIAARYRWDPLESVLLGPVADKLPDPPGGRFELDLQASVALMPVGGEIPAPVEPPQPQEPPILDKYRPLPW